MVAQPQPAEVRPTKVPGIVLWRFKEPGKRHYWVPTHEPSGAALSVASEPGKVVAARNLKGAAKMVDTLGAAKRRGKPVDWTVSYAKLRKNDAARVAIYNAAGFWTIEQVAAGEAPRLRKASA